MELRDQELKDPVKITLSNVQWDRALAISEWLLREIDVDKYSTHWYRDRSLVTDTLIIMFLYKSF
jgi:hypothetical protein